MNDLFERWLFDAEQLPPEEQLALQNTLAVSPAQRERAAGWRQAEADLQASAMVDPAPGFAARWRAAVARRLERRKRLQVGLGLAGSLVGAFTLLGLLAIPLLSSPAGAATAGLEALVSISQVLDAGFTLAGALVEGVPAAAGLLLLSITLAWLAVLWFATLYRYAFQKLPNGGLK